MLSWRFWLSATWSEQMWALAQMNLRPQVNIRGPMGPIGFGSGGPRPKRRVWVGPSALRSKHYDESTLGLGGRPLQAAKLSDNVVSGRDISDT